MKWLFPKFVVLLINLGCASHPESWVPQSVQVERSRYSQKGTRLAVATQGELSSQIAMDVIQKGGSLADAAIAVSFAIGVERPFSTGLGGGGFLLFYQAKTQKTFAIDFRERAPKLATSKMFLDKKDQVVPELSTYGMKAAAVPGLVKGLWEVHQKWGVLAWQELLAPSIAMAEKGFVMYPRLHQTLVEEKDRLLKDPQAKALFYSGPDSTPLAVGQLLIQKDMAKTLSAIAQNGPAGFYQGWVGEAITNQQKAEGGLIRSEDLISYEVKWREPVSTTYLGRTLYSMPPPSSGGVHVLQILKMTENDKINRDHPLDSEQIHQVASAMQRAFADRAKYLGDPDYVKVPVQKLLSADYLKQRKSEVGPSASLIDQVQAGKVESDQTTHFSLINAEGDAVVSTQTINGYFGNGRIVPGTGIFMNNEMDDFSVKPGVANMFGAIGGTQNAVAPGKRPLSSMSPTLVVENQKAMMAVGSPSGTRIISCVALTLINRLKFEMPLWDAVATKRYHHQWSPDEIRVDAPGFNNKESKELLAKGYKINVKDLGCSVQAVDRSGPRLQAVSDPRDSGRALAR